MTIEMATKTKQTTATAHVGVCSRDCALPFEAILVYRASTG